MAKLLSLLQRWLAEDDGADKRKAIRHSNVELVAHYWTGGQPAENEVTDISTSGMHIRTKGRVYPGSILLVTVQKRQMHAEDEWITVQARVVRHTADGMGMQFVLMERSMNDTAANLADRKAMDRFLRNVVRVK